MMRLAGWVVMAAMLGLTPMAVAQTSARMEIDEVARRFDELQFIKDRAGLEALVSVDLRYINGQGRLAGREAFMAATLAPVSHLEPFDIREREITRLGDDAAAVTGFAVVRGVDLEGRRFEVAMRYLDLFAMRDGRWQVVLVQVTPAALPSSPRP